MLHVELGEGVAPEEGPVAAAVVGQHAVDGDAVGGEPGVGPAPERCGCFTGLVVVDLAVGQPGVVIDRGVDVGVAAERAVSAALVAGLVSLVVAVPAGAAELLPSAAGGDVAELLHIDVDQAAGSGYS